MSHVKELINYTLSLAIDSIVKKKIFALRMIEEDKLKV